MNILDQIIASKRRDLEKRMTGVPPESFNNRRSMKRTPFSMKAAILNEHKSGIIAEFKRKSPSRGVINAEASVEEVTTGYTRSGASALSVLTDRDFFGGDESDLMTARELNPIPILRKDFIFDGYQIIEARAMGADAILLIAAVLNPGEVDNLARQAHDLGMEVLLEIHAREELDRISDAVDMIGINNRNLKSMSVDINTSLELISELPREFVRISESGLSSPQVIRQLKSAGYQGFLIGERFMRATDPVVAFGDFVKLLRSET